jgi:uncharacterized protein YggE
MKNKLAICMFLALSMLTIGLMGCNGVAAADPTGSNTVIVSQQNAGIWVNGTGKLKLTPDIAELSIGVGFQASTVAEAQTKAAKAMSDVMNVLKSQGIADKDITTSYYNISPVYNYDKGNQALTGYRVSNTVQVKIRKIADTGKVIDAVTAAAGDATQINGVSFSVDQPEKYYDQMRSLAMADAAAKAKQLASLGNVVLGKITYISEYSDSGTPIYVKSAGAAMDSASVTTPITPGETELQLTVQVIYAIG